MRLAASAASTPLDTNAMVIRFAIPMAAYFTVTKASRKMNNHGKQDDEINSSRGQYAEETCLASSIEQECVVRDWFLCQALARQQARHNDRRSSCSEL
jgi:hypothetical protein